MSVYFFFFLSLACVIVLSKQARFFEYRIARGLILNFFVSGTLGTVVERVCGCVKR